MGEGGTSKKGQQVLTADDVDGSNYLGANTWYGLYNTIRNISANKQMIWGCQYDQIVKFIGEEAQVGHTDRNLTTSPALSGQNGLDEMKNIYDLEGNFCEWTAVSYLTFGRASGGSNYSRPDYGIFYPASLRNNGIPDYATNVYSSRSTLYL